VGQTGEIVSFLFVNKDVTERLRLERQLQQSQKMEAIGTLAGGIAHDFNNILSVIIGYSELVLQTLSPGTREHRNLMEVLNASDRAKKLVSHILAFSSHKEQEYRPISVKFILKESLELLRSMLPATIEIRREVFADNDVVLADPTQLHQIS
jgi:signal transduction histidine kinase